MSTVPVNKDSFRQEVLESDRPVLVDFWAEWCGPCRNLGPVLEEIAQEHPELKVCKVNVDEDRDLAAQYRVMSIPALFAFRGGEVIGQTVGTQPKEQLLALFD